MANLTASFIFSGMSDYWGGTHDRGEGRGCAFAYYGRDTTLRDLVDQWVEDFWINDYDFINCPDSVDHDDIRACILESFTDLGRADYASDAIWEGSADLEDERECVSCGERIGDEHCDDCDNADTALVEEEHCDDCEDYCESPIAIMLIEWTVCEDCANMADPDSCNGTLCSDCNEKHYGEEL